MDHDKGIDRDLEHRLRAERPQLSALELDGLKERVLKRVAVPGPRRKGGFLSSRLALVGVLVTGLLMSGTGATMAVTGIAGDGSASVSQYFSPGSGGVLNEQNSSGNDDATGNDDSGDTDILGDKDQGGSDSTRTRANDQVVAGANGDGLPFTGLVVFPLLLGGVVLLVMGLVLRVRFRTE